jgi:hypothetical protein
LFNDVICASLYSNIHSGYERTLPAFRKTWVLADKVDLSRVIANLLKIKAKSGRSSDTGMVQWILPAR